jgi:hypothetical protein
LDGRWPRRAAAEKEARRIRQSLREEKIASAAARAGLPALRIGDLGQGGLTVGSPTLPTRAQVSIVRLAELLPNLALVTTTSQSQPRQPIVARA